MKQLHSASVRELITGRIEETTRTDMLFNVDLTTEVQSVLIPSFTTESKQMIHEVGNIELCELRSHFGNQSTVQSMSIILAHVGIVYCTCGHLTCRRGIQKRTELIGGFVQYTKLISFTIPSFFIDLTSRATPRATVTGRSSGDREVLHRSIQLKKKSQS